MPEYKYVSCTCQCMVTENYTSPPQGLTFEVAAFYKHDKLYFEILNLLYLLTHSNTSKVVGVAAQEVEVALYK